MYISVFLWTVFSFSWAAWTPLQTAGNALNHAPSQSPQGHPGYYSTKSKDRYYEGWQRLLWSKIINMIWPPGKKENSSFLIYSSQSSLKSHWVITYWCFQMWTPGNVFRIWSGFLQSLLFPHTKVKRVDLLCCLQHRIFRQGVVQQAGGISCFFCP